MTPIRILANEDIEVTCDNSPVSLNCCSEINVNWSKVEWKQEGEITIPGKNVGCSFVTKEIWEGAVGGRGNAQWLFLSGL